MMLGNSVASRALSSLVCVALAGCDLELGVATQRADAGMVDSGLADTLDAAPEVHDADIEPDHAPLEGVRHASCAEPAPNPLPEATLDTDAIAADVNAWSAISCDFAATKERCGPSSSCDEANPVCLRADEKRGEGVCAADLRDRQPSKPEKTTLLSYRDGACLVNVLVEDKTAACCAEQPGFDCRTYPFAVPGKPGERCSDHEDCEEGLLCSAPGVCACPGQMPVVDTNVCLPHHGPLPWPSTPLPEADPGTCRPASGGYRIEVLDRSASRSPVAAMDPDGALHVFYAREAEGRTHIHHAQNMSGAWVTSIVDLGLEAKAVPEPADVVIDSQGGIHLALATHGVRYAHRNGSGVWEVQEKLSPQVEAVAALAVTGGGVPWIAYGNRDMGILLGVATDPSAGESVTPALTVDPTRVQLVHILGESAQAPAPHVFVEFAKSTAHHYWNPDATYFRFRALESFERLDVFYRAGNNDIVGVGSERLPTGRVQLCRVVEDCEVQDASLLIWEQPASRYERAAPGASVDWRRGLVLTYTTPDGRMMTVATLDGTETVNIAADLSPAALVADLDDKPHLFIAGGGSLFHVSKGECPAGT